MVQRKDITGIILAGGKSSRMGADKGFLVLGKSLFIEHVIDALVPLVSNIIIVSDNSDYDEFGYKRVKDIVKNSGPVAGIYSGLMATNTEYNLILSCDIPLINSEMLQKLIENTEENVDVTQVISEGKTMPLVAIYKTSALSVFKELLLKKGEKRLRYVVNQLKTKTMEIEDSMNKYVENINTIDQLIALRNEYHD